MQVLTRCDRSATGTARREAGAAIWHHELAVEAAPTVAFVEYAAHGLSAYVRQFECRAAGIEWVVKPHAGGGFKAVHGLAGVWLQRLPPGTLLFRDPYITDQWSNHWVIVQGDCQAAVDGRGELVICLQPGRGSLAIVGAAEYGTGVAEVEALLAGGAESLLEPTRGRWREFTQRRLAARPRLARLPADAAEDMDGIAVMMKAQQSAQGPTIIGWHTPMAYIRDLYGAARGMLALGLFDEARQSLEFRLDKFLRFGDLRTAELIGTDCARHTYTDEVEGPGYLLLQARDYRRATGDGATVRRLWPMLEWCWNVQQRQLAGGLLPFNGDETYIPYGLFPAEGLQQGSADTTLAFVASGDWLTEWAESERLWTPNHADAQRRILAESRQAWRRWFVDATTARVWVNAPEREQWVAPPRFRRLGSQWLEYDPRSGHYVPVGTLDQERPRAVPPARMTLNSVSLLPDYLGGGLLTADERRRMVERILSFARPNGMIPTALEEDCGRERVDRHVNAAGGGPAGRIGDLGVGYDPGLILIALTELRHPAAPAAYARLMRLLDPAGAWNEYYAGTDRAVRGSIRANLWASGINAEAALGYLLRAERTRR